MCSTGKTWYQRILAFLALTSVVIVIITTVINNQITTLEDTAYLQTRLPIEDNTHVLSLKETEEDITAYHIDTDVIKVLAKLIHISKRHVRGSKTSAYLDLAILQINSLLKGMNVTPESVYRRATKEPLSVCPDRFKGGSFGFPLYYRGFEMTKCAYSFPLSKLITVVKYFEIKTSDFSIDVVNKFLLSVSVTFPDVRVLLSTNSKGLAHAFKSKQPNKQLFFTENFSEGDALNMMISNVKTQYVLVARSVDYFTNDSRLSRLIREIESLDIVVAGGSFRFQNGHWMKGCFQVLYRNFSLKYYEGYDESLKECLFCDYLNGPFVSKTKYLVKHSFDNLNESNGLYEDWFLRIFQKDDECVVCPESMFHIYPRSYPKFNWNTFMHKWKLNEMITNEGFKLHAKFAIAPQTEKRSQLTNLVNLQNASDAVKTIMLSCMEAGVVCELQGGTELGAVKFSKIIPWDIDFEIRFLANNCSKCRRLAELFRRKGIRFGNFVTHCCAKRLNIGDSIPVGIIYNQYKGVINGHPILDSALLVEEGIEPTKALFDGVWMNVSRNPGMSMRNRYGREIYQHSKHWRFTGGIARTVSHRMNYTTTVFLPCATPGSLDCLDTYNLDGNMQFRYLLP